MSCEITRDELQRRIDDTSAHEVRVEFCLNAANAIDGCGRVLWAFGAATDFPEREGLALVCQTAGELAMATVNLYREERWYAGAALVRQFIECEYLVYLFAQEPAHATKWRQSTREARLDFFKPGAMRKVSNGKFRSEEYAIHCERGGRPSPMGSSLLAEHTATLLKQNRYLWCDLGQHLERFWGSFVAAVDEMDLSHIGIIQNERREFPRRLAHWKERDLLSSWVSIKAEEEKC